MRSFAAIISMHKLPISLRTVSLMLAIGAHVPPAMAQTRMTLASIPESIPAVRPDGSISTPDRPGFRVEVLRSAGRQCNIAVSFTPVPWQRALEMVKSGSADGAFSASWSEERGAFAVFPRRSSGELDSAKAMKGYTYSLFVHPESRISWNGKNVSGSDRRVIVERGSAGVSVATKIGLEPLEVSGYVNMVRMLSEKRAQGLVGIDTHVEKILAETPKLASSVKEVQPPLEARHGYVMVNKDYYKANSAAVECLWKAIADIRSKPAYQDLVKSYNNGEFVE